MSGRGQAIGFDRRSLLQRVAFVSAGLWTGSESPTFGQGQTALSLPPEAATLVSKEYGRRRIEKVQQSLRKRGIDGLVVSNRSLGYIQYVSCFTPFPLQPGLAFLPAEGLPRLFVHAYSPAHVRAMRTFVWIEDLIDLPRDEISESDDLPLFRACVGEIKARHLHKGKIGLAGGEVDGLLSAWLREQIPSLRVEDASRMLAELLVVKDGVELALMRHAQRLIDEVAYPAYRQNLRVGASDTAVFAKVSHDLLDAGADASSVLLFDAGPSGSGTWAAGARQRRIERGDVILSEPMPGVLGYQAEKMFVFAMGHVPAAQKRASQVVFEAYEMGIGELRPGREIGPVIEKIAGFLKGKGYEGPTVPIGHWIGAQNHEGPRFTPEGLRGWRLEPGMVLSWHPNVVVPGEARACCSGCLLVTERGVEPLSKLEARPIEVLS